MPTIHFQSTLTKLTLLLTVYQGYCNLLRICRAGSFGCVAIGAGGRRADVMIYVPASDTWMQVPNRGIDVMKSLPAFCCYWSVLSVPLSSSHSSSTPVLLNKSALVYLIFAKYCETGGGGNQVSIDRALATLSSHFPF